MTCNSFYTKINPRNQVECRVNWHGFLRKKGRMNIERFCLSVFDLIFFLHNINDNREKIAQASQNNRQTARFTILTKARTKTLRLFTVSKETTPLLLRLLIMVVSRAVYKFIKCLHRYNAPCQFWRFWLFHAFWCNNFGFDWWCSRYFVWNRENFRRYKNTVKAILREFSLTESHFGIFKKFMVFQQRIKTVF